MFIYKFVHVYYHKLFITEISMQRTVYSFGSSSTLEFHSEHIHDDVMTADFTPTAKRYYNMHLLLL